MTKERDDLLRIADDILQQHGVVLDETELRRLLGVPVEGPPRPFDEMMEMMARYRARAAEVEREKIHVEIKRMIEKSPLAKMPTSKEKQHE